MIETFASDRPDQAVNIWGLPGRPRSGENFGDLQVRCLCTEGVAIDPVTVPEQAARSGVPRECLHDLRIRPLGSGMFRHVEMYDAPPLVVAEQDSFFPQFLSEDPILRYEILDGVLLPAVDRAGKDQEQQLPWL